MSQNNVFLCFLRGEAQEFIYYGHDEETKENQLSDVEVVVVRNGSSDACSFDCFYEYVLHCS